MPFSSSRIFAFLSPVPAVTAFVLLAACGGGSPGATTPNANPQTEQVAPAPPNNSPPPSYQTDAEFNFNWGLGAINADAAYRRGFFGRGVTVGIIDSGVQISHLDLSANIAAGRAFGAGGATTSGADADPSGHGTHVAGIVGGIRDGQRFHGVAPSANIMPLRIADESGVLNGSPSAAFRYAIDNNVKILNNSWEEPPPQLNGTFRAFPADYTFRMPWTEAAIAALPAGESARARALMVAESIGDNDVAAVFAAGNSGWNGDITTDLCADGFGENGHCRDNPLNLLRSPRDITENFVISAVVGDGGSGVLSSPITMSAPLEVTVDGRQTVLSWESASPNVHALVPVWRPQVRGRWLAAVAVGRGLSLAGFSNGCGEKAKHWCLAAPGARIKGENNNEAMILDGTSFSAPHVSGALALLKSRFPQMPMSVLVHLLLTTATDLGDPGVDDIYGHGLVNVAAAITMQGNITLVSLSARGVLLQNANTEVPPSFAGFAKRLNGIGIAAEYLDGFYYDAPLGGMIRAKSKTQPPLNFAAGLFDMDKTTNEDGVFAFSQNGALRAAGWQKGAFQFRHNFHNKPSLWQNESGEFGDITRRPFFADDGGHSDEILLSLGDNFQLFAARGEEQKAEYSQMGISWRRQFSSFPRLQMAATHSHIAEDKTLLGGKFGGVMPLTKSGAIRQTDIGGSYALDKRWRIFGGYQRADIGAKFGGIVGDMSNVAATGWRGGFSAKDYLKKGDTFRIGIYKETTLSRGEVLLRINQSSNPQKDESTQAMHNRGYRQAEKRISLAEAAAPFFTMGYAFPPGDNSQLAIAATHRRHTPSAISIDWHWNF